MRLWDRIHTGMEAGFESLLAGLHVLTEKTGESIELTLLRREKARSSTQLTRLLAQIGNAVYEKISQDRLNAMAEQLGIKDMIIELAEEEARIVDIEEKIRKATEAKAKPEPVEETKEEK